MMFEHLSLVLWSEVSAPAFASGRNRDQVYVLSVLMMLPALQLTNRLSTLFCSVNNTSRKTNEGRHELVDVQSINVQWSAAANIF